MSVTYAQNLVQITFNLSFRLLSPFYMSKLIQSHPKILGVCFLLTINGQMHQQFNTLADLITQPMMEKANCSSLAGSSERTRPLSLTISIRFWQKTERKRRPAWIHFPCNTSNPSHPFNPTTPYFDTSLKISFQLPIFEFH